MTPEFYRLFEPYMSHHPTPVALSHSDPTANAIALVLAIFEVAVIAYFYRRDDNDR